MDENKELMKLHKTLIKSRFNSFPPKRNVLNVSDKHGVYIIYNPKHEVLHVGRTISGRAGLNQRLQNHLYNSSSFSINFLNGNGGNLRKGYQFKYFEIKNARKRTLLELLTTGLLCPKYIGTGNG